MKDGDGSLSRREFADGLRRLGIRLERAQLLQMLDLVDR